MDWVGHRGRLVIALLGLWASLGGGCGAYDAARLRKAAAPGLMPANGDGGQSDTGRAPDAGAADATTAAVSSDDAGVVVGVVDGGVSQDCASASTAEFASCSRPHALAACSNGKCLIVQCMAPWVDCDHRADNGCEATLDSLDHCGLCGARCALPHAQTACKQGKCALQGCLDGFGDCDAIAGNGCETTLDTTDHCGGCNTTCSALTNAAPGCAAGSCGVGQCLGPFGDCDHAAGTGCEQPLSSTTHCGGCGVACAPANATGNCDSGSCAISGCQGSNVDCNGLVGDGCEATLDTPAHCGACSAACELASHATAMGCSLQGGPRCVVDHHCPSGAVGCVEGAPEVGCEPGFGDCDGRVDNGCERRLDTLLDCGGCGKPCSMPNAISACVAGACQVVSCEPGFANCSGGGCTALGSDPANCGGCGMTCSGATPRCAGGKCTGQTCAATRADCNQMSSDGCETSLDDPTSCGLCGLHCGPYPHATPGCQNGRCKLGGCDPGFQDCDGAASNGCEVDVHTLEACGACNAVCMIAFAQESCSNGTCMLVQCDPGRADCNADASSGNAGNGCESSLDDPATCGSCGNDCRSLPNTQSGGCDAGKCQIVCKGGFGDCDGNTQNGCEADLATAKSCGGCGNDCTALPHVLSASCTGALCGNLSCQPGYADCDGITANGCERAVNTLTDCGGCNVACAPAHGSGDCSSGSCKVTTCDSGYDNCNGKATDGCEASLNATGTCGSCGNACSNGMVCQNGTCACTADAQCQSSSYSCCNGACVYTNSVCSLWPCPVPSTNKPLTDCGGCGAYCPVVGAFWCCGALGE
jgi:hypothetical protein